MIKFSPDKLRTAQAVYSVSDETGAPIFVGHCKLTDVYLLRPLVKNPAFDVSKQYSVTVLDIVYNKIEAYNKASAHMKEIFKGETPFFILTSHYNLYGTIICEQTGEVFHNQADICRKLKCTSAQVSNHLRGVQGYNSIKGFTFRRADFLGKDMQKETSPRIATKPMYRSEVKTRQAIRCEQTGQVFSSQLEAANALGINRGQLSQHLQGVTGYNTVKGLTFTRLPDAVPSPKPETVVYPAKEAK